MSLKERLAAYQDHASSRKLVTGDNDDDDDDDGSDEEQAERNMSLKERMAAYQQGASLPTSSHDDGEEEDDDGRPSLAGPSSFRSKSKRSSLADRMAAFGEKPKQLDEPKLSGLSARFSMFENSSAKMYDEGGSSPVMMSSSSTPKKDPALEGLSLKDRMSAFGESNIKKKGGGRKKRQSALQERMAALRAANEEGEEEDEGATPKKEVPQQTGRLADRMAAYKDTVAPGSDLGQFVGKKKKKKGPPKVGSKGGAGGFKVKAPAGSDLSRRMSAFAEAGKLGEFSESKRHLEMDGMDPGAGGLKKRMSAFVPPPQDNMGELKEGESRNEDEPVVVGEEHDAEYYNKRAGKRGTLFIGDVVLGSSKDLGGIEDDGLVREGGAALQEEVPSPDAFANKDQPEERDEIVDVDADDADADVQPDVTKSDSVDIQERMAKMMELSDPEAYERKRMEKNLLAIPSDLRHTIEVDADDDEPEGATKRKSVIQERMAKMMELSDPEAYDRKRMEEDRPTVPADFRRSGGHISERMAKFQEDADIPEGGEDPKEEIPSPEVSLKKETSSGSIDIQERMAKMMELSDPEAYERKRMEEDRPTVPTDFKRSGGDIHDRMAKLIDAQDPEAYENKRMEEDRPAVPADFHRSGGDIHERMAKFEDSSDRDGDDQVVEKLEEEDVGRGDEDGCGSVDIPKGGEGSKVEVPSPDAFEEKEETEQHTNEAAAEIHPEATKSGIQERMAKFKEISSPEAFQKKKPEKVHRPSATAGGPMHERMAQFKDISAADAFQKKKPEKVHRPSAVAGGGIHEKMAQFKDVSAADAFQKKKPEKVHRPSATAGGDINEKMAQFKDVSAADAFQKKKSEEEQTSPKKGVADVQGGGLQQRMNAFKEVSSPDAFQKKKLQGEEGTTDTEETNDHGVSPPTFNPQDGEGDQDDSEGRTSTGGRVVENRDLSHRDEPKDYDYLYDLFVNLEQLKLQDHDSPNLTIILEEGEYEATQKKEEEGSDFKSSLENIIGNSADSAKYTANGDWLDELWVLEHLIEDDAWDMLRFKFKDHTLFRVFDKTREEARDGIIRKFVGMLLKHANDITQLDLSNCLLPDKFLEILAEEVLKNPTASFPRLQLINLESNLLKGPGIEALAEMIRDKDAMRYLQAILLENQKHAMSSEAERSLADAVIHSASIVICSVSIRCPFQQKDINDAILYNMDQLRLARRDHQEKNGTLKERKRNEMEIYFDDIAADESDVTEVDLVGDQKFLTLDEEEKTRSGCAFATNTTVHTIKMELLGLDDHFAEALGMSISLNDTLKKVSIDSNSITGAGMKELFMGLGENSSIEEFQVRHQQKAMASVDEDELPELLADNTTILKLGVDVRSKLVKMKLDRIVNANMDRLRKLRAESKH